MNSYQVKEMSEGVYQVKETEPNTEHTTIISREALEEDIGYIEAEYQKMGELLIAKKDLLNKIKEIK